MLFPARLGSGHCAHRGIEIALPRVFCGGEAPFLDRRNYGLVSLRFVGKRGREAEREPDCKPKTENDKRRWCAPHESENRKGKNDACSGDERN